MKTQNLTTKLLQELNQRLDGWKWKINEGGIESAPISTIAGRLDDITVIHHYAGEYSHLLRFTSDKPGQKSPLKIRLIEAK